MNLNTLTNIGGISSITKIILAAFSIPEEPVTPLPPQIIIFGGKLRTGLSAKAIAANIISKQDKSGRQVGDVFVDGPNVEEAMEVIRVQEIIDAILTDAVVNVAIPPGTSVSVVGPGNLGAPVASFGYTTSIATGNGIIR